MLQFGGSRAFYFFTPNFIQKTANFTINRYKQKKTRLSQIGFCFILYLLP